MCNSNTLKFNPFKNRLLIMFVLVLSLPSNVQSQAKDSEEKNLPELPQMVHPSKGIIIAVLSTMFAIAFLLLLYVKFCRVIPHELLRQNSNLQNFQGLTRPRSRVSGIDKQVIETLPYFKFSSLKGSKEGLECTVCLSKFEDTETLRLLPNGRFHGTSSSNEKENSFTALNNPAEKRCMSEIANVPRFAQMGKDNWIEEHTTSHRIKCSELLPLDAITTVATEPPNSDKDFSDRAYMPSNLFSFFTLLYNIVNVSLNKPHTNRNRKVPLVVGQLDDGTTQLILRRYIVLHVCPALFSRPNDKRVDG
ncbi:hypothetical protein JHK86_009417 [Glycine max]|nr:hypothetical protein JHK86_009417 [Glycine max]